LLGVQPADEHARGHGPVVQRPGQPEQVVPLVVDQVELDAVAQQSAGGAVVRGPDVPESRVGEAGEARRELQAEQVEEREDDVAVAGGVGAVALAAEVSR
jgi:hypothetical protein